MNSADAPRYYWDACIWIEIIQQKDPDRLRRCMHVLSLAEARKAEIWTSAFTLAEVWKRKCDEENVGIQERQDRHFEDFIEKEFITKVAVDINVGSLARRLLRKYPKIGKPQDAIHVATCLLNNVDELHTFDRKDLIELDGDIPRIDKVRLKICEPPLPEKEQMKMDDLGNYPVK